jgi:hypothetical protein
MEADYDRPECSSVTILKDGPEDYLRALSVVAWWRQDGYRAYLEERRDCYVVRKAAGRHSP